jgi:hypothetical protein
MRDLRLPRLLKYIFLSTVLLSGVKWIKIDVFGLPIGPIFSDQADQEEAWTP